MKFLFSASVLALAGLAVAQDYDYIVAGAGAAGLIVAGRLAETGSKVLLIERGHESTASTGGQWSVPWNSSVNYYDVPGIATQIYSKFGEDPQGSPFCDDTADTAGCILGGGTEVNMLAFVKPQPADFERWPAGWKSTDMGDAEGRLYSRNPGTIWPSVDGRRYDQGVWNISSKYFENAGWHEADMSARPDRKHNIFSHSSMSVINGIRAGPIQTYLPLVMGMQNFDLMLNTKVLKVLRDGSKVTGVRVENKGGSRSTINIKQTGRVILASGAMSTPRTLWYSGIGRPDTLTAIRDGAIDIKLPAQEDWINLPVGENFRNHNQCRLHFKTNHPIYSLGSPAFEDPSQTQIDLYKTGSGIMAQTNERGHFWSSIVLPQSTGRKRFFQGIMLPESKNIVEFQLVLSHGSNSMGELGIDASTGKTTMVTYPAISTSGDKSAYAKAIDRLISMSKLDGSPMVFKSSPNGATAQEIVANTAPGKHYVGTAKMGTDDGRNGGTSVVDPNTKVYGTDNLHVVDASIHPDLPTGNTQAIVMVAAEQAFGKIAALDGLTIA